MSKILEKLSKEDLLDLVRKYRRAYFKEIEHKMLKVGDTVIYSGETVQIKQIFSCENYTIYYLLLNGILTPVNSNCVLYNYKND